ncbi:MAG: nitroreductase family protein [Bacteroidales bacterium]|nr:nitroreductase family protein [Bacteroidales bacterium]
MKRLSLLTLIVTLSMFSMAQDIQLPKPNTKGGMPLYEALSNRQTNREFSDKELTEQQLSDLLWCANGENRKDGKRTAPSARNAQEIDIYVFNQKGVFLYIPEKNLLQMVIPEDMREGMSGHGGKMIMSAPVTLLYFANYDKMKGFDEAGREFYGATDAGFVSQNVYLYCAANKLNTVVMGAIDRNKIMEFMKVNGKPVLAQPIGYPVQ